MQSAEFHAQMTSYAENCLTPVYPIYFYTNVWYFSEMNLCMIGPHIAHFHFIKIHQKVCCSSSLIESG